MSVDVFGRTLTPSNNRIPHQGPAGVGFRLTADGNYDLSGKRLSNMADPVDDNDAITLKAMRDLYKSLKVNITEISRKISKLEYHQKQQLHYIKQHKEVHTKKSITNE